MSSSFLTRCIRLTRLELVQICEEHDIMPIREVDPIIPSPEEMLHLVAERYNLTPESLKQLDSEALEVYYEWSRISRKDICRVLSAYFSTSDDLKIDSNWEFPCMR